MESGTVGWLVAGGLALVVAGLLAALAFLMARLSQLSGAAHRFAQALGDAVTAKQPISLPASSPPALRSVARDINARLEEVYQQSSNSMELLASNRMLAREMKRLSALLDSANEGVVALDAAHKVVLASKGAAPFLTVKPEESVSKTASSCLKHQEVLGLLNGQSQELAARTVRTMELSPEVTGVPEEYAVFCSQARWNNEEPAGDLLLFRDISRMKSAQRLQTQFVDSVAHELRTPLTSIRAYCEMLIDGEADDPQMKYDFYNIIYEETYRLSELIDNLLNISMLEGGSAKLDITPVRLKRLIEETVEVIKPQCDKKSIELVSELPDRLPTLNVDKRLLSVALMNILGNAAKYTPDGGTVTLSTLSHEEELQISVRDTGAGIAEEDLQKIFEKFYRAASAASIQGSGVGLSTARQIIQLHGGEIRVSSVLGEGSNFVIALPRTLINTSIGE